MYYTDVASVAVTLACWLAALKGRHLLAGAVGTAAVLVRQTNAVWVGFVLGWAALDMIYPREREGGRGRKGGGARIRLGILGQVTDAMARAWLLRRRLVSRLTPLAAVVVAFALFVVLNGGVVVGDRAHHAPVKHWMQLFYFSASCSVWLAPMYWGPEGLKRLAANLGGQRRQRQWRGTAGLAAVLSVAALVAAWWSTLVHPFLLADNRHYTFYLWRRVLNRTSWARYALAPGYGASVVALKAALWERLGPLRCALLVGATMAVLVPAHLVEFRYFTTPLLLVLLLGKVPGRRAAAATAVAFFVVDAAALYLFLWRPYAWVDGSVARFMW
jgi:alpha-1,2-glucosyltransferase